MSSLAETWISQAAASQRTGRAGRVRHGYCFRLYSRQQYAAVRDLKEEEERKKERKKENDDVFCVSFVVSE
jgi:HrpA-like RNA helicase